MKKIFVVAACILIAFAFTKVPLIKSIETHSLKVPEPSDIAFADGKYFAVSDNGFLFEIDKEGSIIQKAKDTGMDYEGVCAVNGKVMVSDESARQIKIYNSTDLKLEKSVPYNYNGARNAGVEAITYNASNQQYYLFTEKNPCLMLEMNENFQIINQTAIKGLPDISAATFYKNQCWLLSDESHTIYQLDLSSNQALPKYQVNIINPEGFCFDANHLIVMSDDMQKLFIYNQP